MKRTHHELLTSQQTLESLSTDTKTISILGQRLEQMFCTAMPSLRYGYNWVHTVLAPRWIISAAKLAALC